jgi:zinc/manganese transport system permease protein
VSLAFTFLGALLFATIRSRRAGIPQEAIISIAYAVASAATMLALSKATSEAEHLKDMLVGNILAVSQDEIVTTAVLYVLIGMLYADRIGPRLAIGWIMGSVVSALGIYFSLWFDLPTGATIVCTFGGALVLMAVTRPLVVRVTGTPPALPL